MRHLTERVVTEIDLAAARRRAQVDAPFSPAWDADMARVEDLERALWRLDHAEASSETPAA
jgi:hypothetical protein